MDTSLSNRTRRGFSKSRYYAGDRKNLENCCKLLVLGFFSPLSGKSQEAERNFSRVVPTTTKKIRCGPALALLADSRGYGADTVGQRHVLW